MRPGWLTDDWLSQVFGADVRAGAVERIGEGLIGMNLRIALDRLEGDDQASASGALPASIPDSVVVKLPSPNERSRTTGRLLRNYEREVKFYTTLADTVAIRVPHCHFGSWEPDTHDFVLVLEDMAPAEQGDQIIGCDVDIARLAIVELARLHGPRWNDPTLADVDWLQRRAGGDLEALQGLWNAMFPGFAAQYRRHLGDEAFALVEAFSPRVAEWAAGRQSAHLAVTHGDYRLDNLLFGTTAGGPPVCAVDWQTPGHGSPFGDLAYFLGAGLVVDDRRAAERDLVEDYARAVGEFGVDVDRTVLWEQYVRDAFSGIVVTVVASQAVAASDRSEAMFAAMASRHLQHALDHGALDAI